MSRILKSDRTFKDNDRTSGFFISRKTAAMFLLVVLVTVVTVGAQVPHPCGKLLFVYLAVNITKLYLVDDQK